MSVCIIKNITNIPCPSCGSTRSVVSFIDGNFIDSLYYNPIGLIIIIIMITSPIWIIYDLIYSKDTLYQCYRKIEVALNTKIIAIPAIVLILANWIWNIYKGL